MTPRHLQHGPAAFSSRFFPGRQASRIRAIARSDQLPQERAMADATVLTAWLTRSQRAEYAPWLRSGGDAAEFVAQLAGERRVVLEEGADPVADEEEAAAKAEAAARQTTLRVVEAVLLLTALGALAGLIVVGVRAGALDAVPAGAWPLLGVLVVSLVAAAIVGALATRRRDRALLDWAVSRPGQLGRGVPVRRPLQGESAGPAILMVLGPALLVASAVIAICVAAAVLLITLLSREGDGLSSLALWGLGSGVLALVVAVVWNWLRGRRIELMVRRSRAAQWWGPAGGHGAEQAPPHHGG